jgi:uncharacterized metal-binding protein
MASNINMTQLTAVDQMTTGYKVSQKVTFSLCFDQFLSAVFYVSPDLDMYLTG